MPAIRQVKPAYFGNSGGIESHILHVEVEEPVAKLGQRREWIHALEHEVRGIVVEAEGRRRELGEGPPPDCRRGKQVFPPGPLVRGEQHRAVLDGNPHAAFLGQGQERPPDLEEPRPVVIDRAPPVAAGEAVDGIEAKEWSRGNHPLQVGDGWPGDCRVGIERVGIVAKSTQRHAMPVAEGE